jgi:hypothetical protein
MASAHMGRVTLLAGARTGIWPHPAIARLERETAPFAGPGDWQQVTATPTELLW